CIEGLCGRWMPRFRLRRDVGLAPLDLLFEPRFPVVRAGMVSHFAQDDDLPSHVVNLGIGEEDAHACCLLWRYSPTRVVAVGWGPEAKASGPSAKIECSRTRRSGFSCTIPRNGQEAHDHEIQPRRAATSRQPS